MNLLGYINNNFVYANVNKLASDNTINEMFIKCAIILLPLLFCCEWESIFKKKSIGKLNPTRVLHVAPKMNIISAIPYINKAHTSTIVTKVKVQT